MACRISSEGERSGDPYGRADRIIAVGMAAIAGGVLGVARWLHPAARGYGTHTELLLPPCNFLRLTHLPCPSCGMTTSFAWAARMDFWQAFLANPFGLLLFFGTVALIPACIFWCGGAFRCGRSRRARSSTGRFMLRLRSCLRAGFSSCRYFISRGTRRGGCIVEAGCRIYL